MDTLYTRTHEWVCFLPDGRARVGVTDDLVRTKKDPVFINLCDEGDVLRAGEVMGDVEFFKGVVDVHAPVSGTVTRVNEALLLHPQQLADAPEEYWFAELTDVSRDGALWTREAYDRYFAYGKENTVRSSEFGDS